jgi:hypothetical protein
MNLNPATVLDRVLHFLNGMLEEYCVSFCLVFVWLSLILIAWIQPAIVVVKYTAAGTHVH